MSINPSEPDAEGDPAEWVLALARELLQLHKTHGKVPMLIWPDPDCPSVAVVGKRKEVDVKKNKSKIKTK